MSPIEDKELLQGKRLAHFEVGSAIGAGGMGVVYRAHDRLLGRDVALKVLPDEFAKDRDRCIRFEREAKLLAVLNHSNIATIYGMYQETGVTFLALELIEGSDLKETIAAGPMPLV